MTGALARRSRNMGCDAGKKETKEVDERRVDALKFKLRR